MHHNVEIQRYWLNRLLCRHGKYNRKLLFSNNGVVSYCEVCGRKHTGIHDFGTDAFIKIAPQIGSVSRGY